jgi:alpha-glucoside transport system permease protein
MTASSQPVISTATRRPGRFAARRAAAGGNRGRPGRTPRWARERRTVALCFLAPTAIMLVVLVCYPILNTAWLSLYRGDGGPFVGLANYGEMFTDPDTRRAIIDNAVWVVVAPTIVTVLGLMLAVLAQKVRRSTFFRTVLLMPMAISLFAAGVAWRLVYDASPDRGVLNAAIVEFHDVFSPPSRYYGTTPREGGPLSTTADGALATSSTVDSGTSVALPLVGLPADRIPSDAAQAVLASPMAELGGTVWLDVTRGGGGRPGMIDPTEKGLPGVVVEAVQGGRIVGTTTTDASGRFAFPGLTGGGYTIRLPASNFTPPFRGVTWLGPSLITPALIGAYIWIWAGFAMVLISTGLAAVPRNVIEVARVDGASDWQVLRRITVPLMRPVLVVVLVTLAINVLKIFDLVYVLAPEASQGSANVVALEMYRVSFGGGLDYGLGSALAVLLFVLILPAMLFNIRRFRRDAS